MPKTSSVVPKSRSSELKVSSPIAQKGVKRNRDDEATAGASAGVKKSKFNTPPMADEEISENDDGTDGEELEGDEELSAEMQEMVNYLSGLLDSLSKGFLKDVMKGLSGFYGSRSGTNRVMAQSIADHLTQEALNGSNLVHEQKVIKQVYRNCYGGCGEESDSGNEEDEY